MWREICTNPTNLICDFFYSFFSTSDTPWRTLDAGTSMEFISEKAYVCKKGTKWNFEMVGIEQKRLQIDLVALGWDQTGLSMSLYG